MNFGHSTTVSQLNPPLAGYEVCVEFKFVYLGDCDWVSQQADPSRPHGTATWCRPGDHAIGMPATQTTVSGVTIKGDGQCWQSYTWVYCWEFEMPSGTTVTMNFEYPDPDNPPALVTDSRTYTFP